MFTCKNCNEKQKESRGCLSPIDEKFAPVITIKECAICGGEDKECSLCHGKDKIEYRRCPVAMSKNAGYLIPHLSRLRQFGVFPDGSFSALKQGIPFLLASRIYDYYYAKFQAEYKP